MVQTNNYRDVSVLPGNGEHARIDDRCFSDARLAVKNGVDIVESSLGQIGYLLISPIYDLILLIGLQS